MEDVRGVGGGWTATSLPALARAGVAIAPEKAISDGAQSLDLPQFQKMMKELQPYIALWKELRETQTLAVAN